MGFAFKSQALLSEVHNIVFFDEHYSRTESFVRSLKPAELGGYDPDTHSPGEEGAFKLWGPVGSVFINV